MCVNLLAVGEMIASIMLLCPLSAKILQNYAEFNQKGFLPKALISALGFKLLNALGLSMIVDFCIEM